MARVGRPPKCGGCGDCDRCARAAYMRSYYARFTPEERKAGRARSAAKRDPGIDEQRRARDRDRGARQPVEYQRKYRNEKPWVNAAHVAVSRAGLERKPCERCGAARSHAHHDDYSKPLDVKWLCALHHKARHKELEEAGLDPHHAFQNTHTLEESHG